MRKPIGWLILAAAVVCVAALLYSWHRTHRPVPATAALPAPVAAPAPAIANPVPPAAAGAPALPPLNDSDSVVHDTLDSVADKPALDPLLDPANLVRRIVATVDNLPRGRVAVEMRPVKPVPGKFLVDGSDQQATIADANYARYNTYVQLLQGLDVQPFAAAYFRLYPLFQQAYQDLGYPNGYFNDRVVQVIDDLLATPDVTGPIKVARPNVMYEYADPALEKLSAGQKLMLRIGPKNAAIVKAKLRELRAVLIAQGGRKGGKSANP